MKSFSQTLVKQLYDQMRFCWLLTFLTQDRYFLLYGGCRLKLMLKLKPILQTYSGVNKHTCPKRLLVIAYSIYSFFFQWEFVSAFHQAHRIEFAFSIVNAGMRVVLHFRHNSILGIGMTSKMRCITCYFFVLLYCIHHSQ